MNIKFFYGLLAAIPFIGAEPELHPPAEEKTVEVPPNVWLNLRNDLRTSFSLDFLYWQTSQTGMSYGTRTNKYSGISVPGGGTATFTGNRKNIHFEMDPGVRLAFGVRPFYDEWQINLTWTNLNSKASGGTDLPNVFFNSVISPGFSVPQLLSNNGINAKAHWQTWYNTLDLDLSKGLSFSHFFGLKPHLGLRNLWLGEKYNILSINTYNSSPPTPPTSVFNSEGKLAQDIWGIGPMIGIDSLWKIYKGFGVFGNVMLSLVWSHVTSTNRGISFFSNPPTTTTKQWAGFHTLLSEIDFAIGGIYDVYFRDDRYHLAFRLGWELHSLQNANFLGAADYPIGDFNINGLTTGFTFDF